MASLYIFVCLCLFFYSLPAVLHIFQRRLSLAPLYALVGFATVMMVLVTDTGLMVQVGGMRFLLGSSIFFVCVMLTVFIIYAFESVRAARLAMLVTLSLTIACPLLQHLFTLAAEATGTAASFFPTSPTRIYLASTGTMALSFIVMAISWQALHNAAWRYPLALKVFGTLLVTLEFDALVFVTVAFIGMEEYSAILGGHLTNRLALSLVASPVLAFYMTWRAQRQENLFPQRHLFAILTSSRQTETDLQDARREIALRQKAEAALRESQERYLAVFLHSPVGILHFDEAGVVVDCNERLADILGTSRQTLQGFCMLEQVQNPSMRNAIQTALSGAIGSFNDHYQPIMGSRMAWLRCQFRLLFNSEGNRIGGVGIIDDLTEQKHAQETLQEERELFVSGPTVVFKLHYKDHWPVEYVSPNIQEVFGYAQKMVVQQHPFASLLHPDDWKMLRENIRALIKADGRRMDQEYRLRDAKGLYRWVRDHTLIVYDRKQKPARLLRYLIDISEQRALDASLREREEMFRSISASAHDAIIMMGPQGEVSFWNEAAEQIFGYTREEALQKPLHELIAPKEKQEHFQKSLRHFAQSDQDDVLGRVCEIEGLHQHGRRIPLELSVSPVKLQGAWNTVAVVRDVSKRKQVEEQLRNNETRFRTMLDSMPVGILIVDQVTASIQDANPAAIAMAERPYENILQMQVDSLLEETGKNFDAGPMETAIRLPNGSRMPVLRTVVQLELGDRPHRLEILLDHADRKRAEDALRRHDAILEAVNFAGQRFLEGTDPKHNIEKVLQQLGRATGVSRVYVFENHRGPDGSICMTQQSEWCAEGITPQIDNPDLQSLSYKEIGFQRWENKLSRGEAIYGDITHFPPEEKALLEPQGILSIVVTPILVNEIFWGFIGFDECKQSRTWTSIEVEALYGASRTLGLALARHEAEKAVEEARIREQELESRIEEVLLRGRPPQEIQGAEIAALSVPSQHMDGDFYDFFQHKPTCFDIVIGDVMGKGIQAALIGAGAKSSFLRSLSQVHPSKEKGTPPSVQHIVSDVFEKLAPQLLRLDRFITLVYARINTQKQCFEFIDCGHMRTIHWKHQEKKCAFLSGNNMPLGFVAHEDLQMVETPIQKGDLLVFYSDGVTEAKNARGEYFDENRLARYVEDHHQLSPNSFVHALRGDVSVFAQSETFNDDFTCIVVRLGKSPMQQRTLTVNSDLAELRRVRHFLQDITRKIATENWTQERETLLLLAVQETLVNIIEHGLQGKPGTPIEIQVEWDRDHLTLTLLHAGKPFDASHLPDPDLETTDLGNISERGRGLYIIRHSSDAYTSSQLEKGRASTTLLWHLHAEA